MLIVVKYVLVHQLFLDADTIGRNKGEDDVSGFMAH